MNTIIVYYSLNGNTAFVAHKVAELLRADLLEIRLVKQYPDKGFKKFFWGGKSAVMAEEPALLPYTFRADKYDQVVFGFPVWAGNITPPLRTFIKENRTALNGKRIAAFACQSGAGADKAFGKLSECLGGITLAAQLVLIDPKVKLNPDNDVMIKDFCDKCR